MEFKYQDGIHDWPTLPAGVKFDPSDQEILEYLQAKVWSDAGKLHPLIDEFIPTIEGENGIWSTHPEKLPGVGKDGQFRHFFHRPSKAYITRARERRKVHTDEGRERRKVYTDEEGIETRWHKTGKTRAVFSAGGAVKGFKKILVLYTYYGKKKKPEKTNWVMHQYHLGSTKKEKDGELVVSKIFYQRQPKQCGSQSIVNSFNNAGNGNTDFSNSIITFGSCYYSSTSVCETEDSSNRESSTQLIVAADDSYIRYAMDAKKARFETNIGKSF